jgi:integrase
LVFPSEVGTPVNASNLAREFRRLVARTGVPQIPIHGIRHTVASLAIASGQDIRTVSDLLGHARTSITADIYAHVLPGRTTELAQAISDLVLRPVAAPPAPPHSAEAL